MSKFICVKCGNVWETEEELPPLECPACREDIK